MNNSDTIDQHRTALLRIVAGLFAFMEWVPDMPGPVERVTRPVYQAVLRLLVPAESALRRLIVVMAREIVVTPRGQRKARSKSESKMTASGDSEKTPKKRRRLFRLFETLARRAPAKPVRSFAPEPKALPRIHIFPYDTFPTHVPSPIVKPEPVRKPDDGMVSAAQAYNRLVSLSHALEDIQGQAKRLARWLAKAVEDRRPSRESPLLPGLPPGLPDNHNHEVHKILDDCYWLVDRSLSAAIVAERQAVDTS